ESAGARCRCRRAGDGEGGDRSASLHEDLRDAQAESAAERTTGVCDDGRYLPASCGPRTEWPARRWLVKRIVMRASLVFLTGTMIVITMTATPHAQRRGGGGMPGRQVGGFPLTRLEILTADFQLNKDQKKAGKELVCDARKA